MGVSWTLIFKTWWCTHFRAWIIFRRSFEEACHGIEGIEVDSGEVVMKEISYTEQNNNPAAYLFHDVPEAGSWSIGRKVHVAYATTVPGCGEDGTSRPKDWRGAVDVVIRCLCLIITSQTCCDYVRSNYYNISANNFTPQNNVFNSNYNVIATTKYLH